MHDKMDGMSTYDTFARLAEDTLYSAHTDDDEPTEVAKGQAWATLALAASIQDLAQSRADS